MEKVYMDFDEPGDLFDPLPLVSAFGNALDYSQLDVAREIVRIHENSDACFWDMRFLIEPRSGLLLHAVRKGHPELVKRIYKMNKRGMAEVVVATCRIGCYLNWESNDVVAELLEKDFLKKFNKDAGFSGRETVIALMGMVDKPSKSVFFRNVQLYAAAFGFLDVLTAARSKNLGSPVSILAVGLAAEYGYSQDSAENAVKNLRVDYDAKDLWNKDACEMSSDDEDSLKKKKPNSSKSLQSCKHPILNGHLIAAQSLLDKGSVFEPDDWKAGEAGRSAICDIKKVNSEANSFLKKLLTSAK
ncbi:hypothetical protein BDR26DRAFT_860824 [Obelidium mucronatum]|nr:hypothetical protein BDR26DRAFT_860824 [Obelidium mucronatum]